MTTDDARAELVRGEAEPVQRGEARTRRDWSEVMSNCIHRMGTVVLMVLFCHAAHGQADSARFPQDPLDREILERFRALSERAERAGLAEPFEGVTTNGEPMSGLYELRSTGVSTRPVVEAARAFLSALENEQRERTVFPVDDPEWRKWMNQHFYLRQGVGFVEMSERQREAAFALLGASLSARGLELTRDIMRLNYTLGELNDNFAEYGEWLYWITVMGEPSESEPWGWQLDGHHLIVNYFVLGDQVVMSPFFVGSEPVVAESGRYEGTAVLQEQQAAGLALVRSLDGELRDRAILEGSKTGNNTLAEAFRDNLVLDYAGAAAASFDDDQRQRLLDLVELFVGNLREGHAEIRMEEVAAHLDDTYFAWIGGTEDDSVFYFRVHGPVILIEFDHQRPIAMRHLLDREAPSRQHIHAVVRTPNGNDYGKDLLRQHYSLHPHE